MARILKRLPRDVNSRAVAIARAAIEDDPENIDPRPLETIARGREKAAKGGQARADALSPARKSAIARSAARARWRKSSKASK